MEQVMPPGVDGRVSGAVTTVSVSGQVGWPELPGFQRDLHRQLRRTPDVVIDLSDLDSWSVTAQALFIGAVHRARQCGQAVAVIDLKDRPWLQLESSGLASELYKALWTTQRAPRPMVLFPASPAA